MPEHHYLPSTKRRNKKDLEHTVSAESLEDAEEWFVDAKNRLLDVNHWKNYSKHLTAEFALTDAHGKNVNRRAHSGDHLRIEIPGPRPVTGSGCTWVLVEAIEYDDYPDEDRETLAMRVRPSSNPQHNGHMGVAQSFSYDATSTFVIERTGKHISALYHRRNESANTDTGDIERVNNTTTAIDTWLGMSDAQWSVLIKGLLE